MPPLEPEPDSRLDALPERLEGLAREVRALHERVAALEARSLGGDGHQPGEIPLVEAPGAAPGAALPTPAGGVVSLLGRTLVALGGAYLLRAVTDAGAVPKPLGLAAGLAYATAWLLVCEAEGARGRRTSAAFHALAAAAMGFPLIAEATARLGLLGTRFAAAALAGFAICGLAVAWRQRSKAVAWVMTLSAAATALGLILATHDLLSFTASLAAVAAAVEVLAFRDTWTPLRWPAALALDAAGLVVAALFARPEGLPEGYPPSSDAGALGCLLLVPLLYAGSIAARTLLRRRPITAFEALQLAAALLVGLGGATRIVALAEAARVAAGMAALGLGLAFYAAAFAILEPRVGRTPTFHVHATFAGILLFAGLRQLLADSSLAGVLLAVAAGLTLLGLRSARDTLVVHGAASLWAAAMIAGLLGAATDGGLGPAAGPWRPVTPGALAALLVAAACLGLLLLGDSASRPCRLARDGVLALLAWCVVGLGARALVLALGAGPDAAADAALVATSRTGVTAALAAALAAARRRLPAIAWPAYPLLVVSGLELLLEDVPNGRPATLFFSLIFCGGALFAVPRLLRNRA